MYDVTLGTLTHGNDVVCMLACIAAFVGINQAVDLRKTMWKSQENKVVNSHHTLYFPYPMDGQGKFVTQSVEQLYVVPIQSPAYASHTPQRSHSSPEPIRRIMYRYRSPAFGHHRRELLIFTVYRSIQPILVFRSKGWQWLHHIPAVIAQSRKILHSPFTVESYTQL